MTLEGGITSGFRYRIYDNNLQTSFSPEIRLSIYKYIYQNEKFQFGNGLRLGLNYYQNIQSIYDRYSFPNASYYNFISASLGFQKFFNERFYASIDGHLLYGLTATRNFMPQPLFYTQIDFGLILKRKSKEMHFEK